MAEQPEHDLDLDQLRKRLDECNAALVSLLNERALLAMQVGSRKGDGPVYVPAREAEILDAVSRLNDGPMSDSDLRDIFRDIIGACRNLQREVSAAYLGPAGTYTEEASRRHLGPAAKYLPYDTIEETATAAEKGEATLAVIPVENSIEGPVGQTLDVLRTTTLSICGEVTLPIHHQLLTHAESLDKVTDVTAHPQTLAQCRKWLRKHLPDAKQHAASSNAEAAKRSASTDGMAAIAGRAAAEMYGLPIVAADIEDEATNTTRFLVLGNDGAGPTGNDRTSIMCAVANEAGALYRLLAVFADNGVSMTKLESRPVRNDPWQYVFYVDLDGHSLDEPLRKALEELKPHAAFIKILGSYPKAR